MARCGNVQSHEPGTGAMPGVGPGDTTGSSGGRYPQERPGLAAQTSMLHVGGLEEEKKQDFCGHACERPVSYCV